MVSLGHSELAIVLIFSVQRVTYFMILARRLIHVNISTTIFHISFRMNTSLVNLM